MGVEAQFYEDDEFRYSRRFDSRLDSWRPPRELAIAWAEEMRTWTMNGGPLAG